jgi:peptidoglycan/LPS O-acetylase OafA/YrhL
VQPKSSLSGASANLDLIRAVAVICVLVSHLYDIVFRTDSTMTWRLGQVGVLIFFVHTSLVLMLSLERAEQRGETLIGDFYIRRIFRIYPLAMVCVTIAFLLNGNPTWREFGPRHWTWFEYATNMSLTMNLTYSDPMVGPLWTLPLEVQMYVILPFLFFFARSRPLWMMAGIWAVAVVAGYLQPFVSGRLNVIEYAPCFVAGVIAWRVSLTMPRTIPGWLWPLGFAALWPLFLAATKEHHVFLRWGFCLALSLAIPWFQEMKLGPLNRCAQVNAKYSYGIYLSHEAVGLFAFSQPWPFMVQLATFLAGATIAPVLMYHFIEYPMIRAGQRLVALRRGIPEKPLRNAASAGHRPYLTSSSGPDG